VVLKRRVPVGGLILGIGKKANMRAGEVCPPERIDGESLLIKEDMT